MPKPNTMNYLVINDELIYSALSPELKKLYDHYMNGLKQRTEFEKLRSKLNSNRMSPTWYNEKCTELASRVKNVSYRQDRMLFQVEVQYKGKRCFLGQDASFDVACELLSEFLKMKMEEDKSDK